MTTTFDIFNVPSHGQLPAITLTSDERDLRVVALYGCLLGRWTSTCTPLPCLRSIDEREGCLKLLWSCTPNEETMTVIDTAWAVFDDAPITHFHVNNALICDRHTKEPVDYRCLF